MSNLIQINRDIYLSLKGNLKEAYIRENIEIYTEELIDKELLEDKDIDYILEGIQHIIKSNEKFHKRYGVLQKNGKKQVDDTCKIKSGSEPTGFYHSTGTLVICPFDWSWDDNGDFDYSFYVARSL